MLIIIKNNRTIKMKKISFTVWYGWKLILSKLLCTPKLFLDPFICKVKMWIKDISTKIKGTMKCKEKNRTKVVSLTPYLPQIDWQIISPPGNTEIKLVITATAQNDIWPHGNTYPRKAAPIRRNIIDTPVNHSF